MNKVEDELSLLPAAKKGKKMKGVVAGDSASLVELSPSSESEPLIAPVVQPVQELDVKDEIEDIVNSHMGLVLGDEAGDNFVAYGDTRFHQVTAEDRITEYATATDNLHVVGDGLNTLIALDNIKMHAILEKHLADMGIAPLDGPYCDASRKISMSKAIMQMFIPLFAVISGNNCYQCAEKSKLLQEACGELIWKAVRCDLDFRHGLSKMKLSTNADNHLKLYREMLRLRGEFAEAITMVKVGRLRAIEAINRMETYLAVSKVNAAAHHIK